MDYGTGPNGERICCGAQMGRANSFPEYRNFPVKLRMKRLRFVDGDYDQGGAYWGSPANLWLAVCTVGCKWQNYDRDTSVFVRANSRQEAKAKVRQLLPKAIFYR
jgi:hypothetical protein